MKYERHGYRWIPEYEIWKSLKQRCLNPKAKGYEDYGGRGIKVCARWRHSFTAFYNDMGPRPKGAMLDRRNNDGDYSPANCRWATPRESILNRRKPTHCKRGHAFTVENTRVYRGLRICRACARVYQLARYHAQKAKAE